VQPAFGAPAGFIPGFAPFFGALIEVSFHLVSFSVNGASVIWRETFDALFSVFFPAPCRICGEMLLTASPIPICDACLDSFERLTGPACRHCGRPFISPVAAQAQIPLCHLCRRGVYGFDLARSFASYNDAMAQAITLLKYEAVTRLGNWFAARLLELAAHQAGVLPADVVVPVPLHPLRLRERGYNQAELIARPLANLLHLPLGSYLLVRTKPRPDKHRLTRQERWRTVRGAYATRQGTRVDKLRILLVDDVFTTGATLDACSRALRNAGAARVVGLTVARVLPNWSSSGPVAAADAQSIEANQSVAAGILQK
jgi:ComF family protein